MNIKQLKDAISGLPDNAPVYLRVNGSLMKADYINASYEIGNVTKGDSKVVVGFGNCPWDELA